MLNPNQGKEQFVQTTFPPPPPPTLYSCNSPSSAALNKASWDPTSREICAEACRRSVGLKGVAGGVTCFLQDCSTFWDRIFAALFLAAKDPYIIWFLLKKKPKQTSPNHTPKTRQPLETRNRHFTSNSGTWVLVD